EAIPGTDTRGRQDGEIVAVESAAVRLQRQQAAGQHGGRLSGRRDARASGAVDRLMDIAECDQGVPAQDGPAAPMLTLESELAAVERVGGMEAILDLEARAR